MEGILFKRHPLPEWRFFFMLDEQINSSQTDPATKGLAMIQQRCYTVKDLQTILGVSRGTVYQLMKRKEFRWFQIGNGRYRISRKSFDEWLDKNS